MRLNFFVITLSGIEKDNKLNFEKHVTEIYQKASHHLNTLSVHSKYIVFQEMKMLLEILYSQILTTVPLRGISALPPCHRK